MKNEETTRVLNEDPTIIEKDTQVVKENKSGKAEYIVGGFAGGFAAAAGASAVASNMKEDVVITAESLNDETQQNQPEESVAETTNETPSEQDVIVATDEGVRVAQVDDNKSFSEAFADARAQVGAGGVFEWHGKVYGTYYKNEWDQMSSAERAEWQAKIDYNDVRDEQEAQHYAHHNTHHASHTTAPTNDYLQSSQETIDSDPADGEIRVLGVETVEGPNGQPMNFAALEASNGDQALLVDIDNDGNFDVLLHDDNGDGQLQESEVYDASGVMATVEDLQSVAEQSGMSYANNDDMPDYMNDADISSMV